MGGIVQLRGLFAARETQVLAQSFSARFPFPTRIVEQLAYGKDLKGGAVPGIAQVPGIIAFAGGLPIMIVDNVHIGGIGVSGTADQDETCAQAGIDSVKIYSNSGRGD